MSDAPDCIPKAEALHYNYMVQNIVPWDMAMRHEFVGRHEDLSQAH